MSNIHLVERSEIESLNKQLDLIIQKIDRLKVPSTDDLLTNKEVIAKCDISSRTLQNWRDSGNLKYSKVGKKCFYKQSDLDDFLAKHIV